MNQYDFQKTLKKYLAGEQTPEEEEFILDYLKNDPLDDTAVFEEDKQVIGNRIKKRLYANAFGKPLISRLGPWLAAASVLILMGCWYFLAKKDIAEILSDVNTNPDQEVIEIKNTSGKSQTVPLEDGSIVILEKNSSISFPERFDEESRLVFLHGEAFFKIKENTRKPFIVSAGNLMTKVLGTSFHIKSYDRSPSVEVRVKTGRVSVYESVRGNSVNRNGVILTPNQKIIFDKRSKKMELSIVENPIVVIPEQESTHGFSFSEVPVKKVFSDLQKSYGIDIVLENDTADSCLFTGDLNGLSLFQQLDLICKSANFSYERRGTALFIQGTGCRN
jgi:transmembrane sensor